MLWCLNHDLSYMSELSGSFNTSVLHWFFLTHVFVYTAQQHMCVSAVYIVIVIQRPPVHRITCSIGLYWWTDDRGLVEPLYGCNKRHCRQGAQLSQRGHAMLHVTEGHSRSLKLVAFESLGTVSYLHFIATLAVSLAVLTQYTNVTDARDTARQHRPRSCVVLRYKNGNRQTVLETELTQ